MTTTTLGDRQSFHHHTCVTVRCTRCGEQYEEDWGTAHFSSRESATASIADGGWQDRGGEAVCRRCSDEDGRADDDRASDESFVRRECVSVHCWRCWDQFGGDYERHFQSVAEAAEAAVEDGWDVRDGKAICESCRIKTSCAHAWPVDPDHVHNGMEYRSCELCGTVARAPAALSERGQQ